MKGTHRHRSRIATIPRGYSSGRASILCEPHAEHLHAPAWVLHVVFRAASVPTAAVNSKARRRRLRAGLCVNTGGFSYWRVMLREFVLVSFQTMYGAVARRRARAAVKKRDADPGEVQRPQRHRPEAGACATSTGRNVLRRRDDASRL